MKVQDYGFTLEQCDVPESRRRALEAYRAYRRKCLEHLKGDGETSITTQVHDLVWHTMTYRTLNEARRLEPARLVNGDLWNLVTAGYASLMTMGIRRLVDKDKAASSVYTLVERVGKCPELLTREFYVCHDGLPFNDVEEYRKFAAANPTSGVHRLETTGRHAWAASELLHRSFDKVAGSLEKRKRGDAIPTTVLAQLKEQLQAPVILKVCTMVDKMVAHTENMPDHKVVPIATYNDIDEALRIIVRVANFVGHFFFYEDAFGSVVPTPQYDVLASLDESWVLKTNLPALNDYWHEQTASMNMWAYNVAEGFMPLSKL